MASSLGPGAFRLLLALAVVVYHVTGYLAIGTMAVYVFFVLSGFWISVMYSNSYSRLLNPYRTFLFSRLFRLYPLYLASIALYFTFCKLSIAFGLSVSIYDAVTKQVDSPYFWARNLSLFLLDDFPVKVLVPAWSLDYEFQFYLVAPFIFWLVPKHLSARAILFFCCTMAALVMAFTSKTPIKITMFLPFFVVGILIHRGDARPRNAWLIPVTLAMFTAVFLLPYLLAATRKGIIMDRDLEFAGLNLFNTYNVVLAALLVPFAADNVRRISTRFDKMLGNLSYAVYLFHWVLIVPVDAVLADAGILKIPGYAGFVALSIGGGYLLLRLVDEPCESARKRWLRSRGCYSTESAAKAIDR